MLLHVLTRLHPAEVGIWHIVTENNLTVAGIQDQGFKVHPSEIKCNDLGDLPQHGKKGKIVPPWNERKQQSSQQFIMEGQTHDLFSGSHHTLTLSYMLSYMSYISILNSKSCPPMPGYAELWFCYAFKFKTSTCWLRWFKWLKWLSMSQVKQNLLWTPLWWVTIWDLWRSLVYKPKSLACVLG